MIKSLLNDLLPYLPFMVAITSASERGDSVRKNDISLRFSMTELMRSLLVPVFAVMLTAYGAYRVFETNMRTHVENTDVHMKFEDKVRHFLTTKEFNAYIGYQSRTLERIEGSIKFLVETQLDKKTN